MTPSPWLAAAAALIAMPVLAQDDLLPPDSRDVMECPGEGEIGRTLRERDRGHFACGVNRSMIAPPMSGSYAPVSVVRGRLGRVRVHLVCAANPRSRDAHHETGAVIILEHPFEPRGEPAITNTLVRSAMRVSYARCPVRNFPTPTLGFVQIVIAEQDDLRVVAEVRNYGLGVWNQTTLGPAAGRLTPRWRPPVTPAAPPPPAGSLPTRPVSGGVNAPFLSDAYRTEFGKQHLGVDLAASAGTRVVSPVDGLVVLNETARAASEAYLVIREPNGVEHVLAHISSDLLAGTSLRAGEEVGRVQLLIEGARDRSHVHWGVNRQGVLAAMGPSWGWGMAPADATRQEAEARGWIDPLVPPRP